LPGATSNFFTANINNDHTRRANNSVFRLVRRSGLTLTTIRPFDRALIATLTYSFARITAALR
jgi:hypothetical protein